MKEKEIQTCEKSKYHIENSAKAVIGHIGDKINIYIPQSLPKTPIPDISKEDMIQRLKDFYLEDKTIELLIGKLSLPIDKIYTRLAIIGETEKKEKKEQEEKGNIETLEDDRIPTYETIFEAKTLIKLKQFFEHEKFQKKPQKRAIIFGAAGIGKSTLLHKIALPLG